MNNGRPDAGRKRPRDGKSALESAYDSVQFRPIESSGRPGTPHRFFKESFDLVHRSNCDNDKEEDDGRTNSHRQVVHKHVNGLAVITAGSRIRTDPDEKIKEVRFEQQPAAVASESAGRKRKQQAEMLKKKGGKQQQQQQQQRAEGIVDPTTVLAKVVIEKTNNDAADKSVSERVVPLYAGVWGSVLEVNPNMSPQLLALDPLLDGYLAVILPTGRFPLQESLIANDTGAAEDNKRPSCPVRDGAGEEGEISTGKQNS